LTCAASHYVASW